MEKIFNEYVILYETKRINLILVLDTWNLIFANALQLYAIEECSQAWMRRSKGTIPSFCDNKGDICQIFFPESWVVLCQKKSLFLLKFKENYIESWCIYVKTFTSEI